MFPFLSNIQKCVATFLLMSVGVFLLSASSGKKVKGSDKISIPFETTAPTASYIYAPGFMGSELLMGRYCTTFTAHTGEKITWNSGGNVIGAPYSAVLFPEVILNKPTAFTLNPLVKIVNNLRLDLFPFIQRIFQDLCDFHVEDNPLTTKSVVNYTFDLSQANLGQHKDIAALCKTYKEHSKRYPNTPIVLYGDSRGAATAFNFCALHHPSGIHAVILDGIFDSVPHCIKHFIYDDKEERAEERLHDLIPFFARSYNKKGPFPRQLVYKFPLNIPTLFVISLKDGLVPAQGVFWLYKQLVRYGHKKVHLLVLQNAFHPAYMLGNSADKQTYQNVVHAFYKYYNLPYNAEYAHAGQEDFKKTQPTIQELENHYQLPTCLFCK